MALFRMQGSRVLRAASQCPRDGLHMERSLRGRLLRRPALAQLALHSRQRDVTWSVRPVTLVEERKLFVSIASFPSNCDPVPVRLDDAGMPEE